MKHVRGRGYHSWQKTAVIAAAATCVVGYSANADVTMTTGSGVTVFDFTCFSTKHCPAAALTDGAGDQVAGATGAAVPAGAIYMGITSGGNLTGWTGAVTQGGAPWTQNVTQFGGSNVATGTGAGGSGVPRVTISNDSSLAANQSVNAAQLGGTTVSSSCVSNYGTSPGAVACPSSNAFITNTPNVVVSSALPAGSNQIGTIQLLAGTANIGNVGGITAASTTMQNAATGSGNGSNLTVTNYANALVNVNCSVACSGGTTINFEGTDSTGTFFSIAAFPVAGGASVTTATTSGQFWVPVAGLTSVRARISGYSAGTITVTGTPMYGVAAVQAPASSGSNPAAGATGSGVPAQGSYSAVNVSGTLRGTTGLGVGSQFAQTVAVVDSSGNQISSFGGSGGTAQNDASTFTQGTTSFTPTGGYYNTSPSLLSSAQGGAFLLTADRFIKSVGGLTTSTLTGWTSSTGSNTTQTLTVNGNTGGPALLLQLDQTSTLTGGAITIEGSYDAVPNWVTIPTAQVLNPNTGAQLTNPYTLVASTNQPFLILTQGYNSIRIRLSTVITGTATVTPYVAVVPYSWFNYQQITQGGNIAAVKSASTAAATTDPALVVRDVGVGDPTDSACASSSASPCGLVALTRLVAANTGSAIPAGSALIGNVGLAQASTTSGQSGPLVQCAVTTSAPSYTTAQTDPLSCDTSGNLRISLAANQSVNVAQYAGTNAVTGGVNGTVGVGGLAANGASVSGNPILHGGRAQNAEITPVTNGQAVDAAYDLVGKQIVMLYANKEVFVSGAATQTGTTATTIIASAGGSLKNYITSVQCARDDAGTTAMRVTFNDANSTVMVLPNNGGGGGNNMTFPVPIATAAATAFQFTPSTSITTIRCNAQGYTGT